MLIELTVFVDLLEVVVGASRRKANSDLEAFRRLARPVITNQLIPQDTIRYDPLREGLIGEQLNMVVELDTHETVLARVGALVGLLFGRY